MSTAIYEYVTLKNDTSKHLKFATNAVIQTWYQEFQVGTVSWETALKYLSHRQKSKNSIHRPQNASHCPKNCKLQVIVQKNASNRPKNASHISVNIYQS